MKILRNILLVLGLIVLVGFFLPGTTHIERSTVIKAPVAKVFGLVSDLRNMQQWSPWQDSLGKWTFSDTTHGMGAFMAWDTPKLQQGKLTILEVVENKKIHQELEFGGMGKSIADYQLEDQNGSTKITWTMDTENGLNPLKRWMGVLMMDRMLGKDYEQGLANLKAVCEK
jgi:carbon monoxide dehydrogenase subunit G